MANGTHDQRQAGHASAVCALIYILFGPIVWALHLTAIYGAHAVLCARGVSATVAGFGVHTLLIAAITAAAIALLLVTIFVPRVVRRLVRVSGRELGRGSALERIAVLLGVLSIFGVAWAGATSLLLPVCAQLR